MGRKSLCVWLLCYFMYSYEKLILELELWEGIFCLSLQVFCTCWLIMLKELIIQYVNKPSISAYCKMTNVLSFLKALQKAKICFCAFSQVCIFLLRCLSVIQSSLKSLVLLYSFLGFLIQSKYTGFKMSQFQQFSLIPNKKKGGEGKCCLTSDIAWQVTLILLRFLPG